MDEQIIRYMHLRRSVVLCGKRGFAVEVSPTGGITVAYYKIGPNQYKCAFARCNIKDKDHYNKTRGRDRAKMFLLEDDDVWMLDLDEDANVQKAIAELVLGIKEFRRALRPEVR